LKKQWIIFGAGGHGKVIRDILIDLEDLPEVIVYDDHPEMIYKSGDSIRPPAVLPPLRVLHGIGNLKVRKELQLERYPAASWSTIVAVTAHVANNANICCGAQVLNFAYVGPDTIIGRGCIVNNHASIDHDCNIGEFSHIAPGTVLCGCVTVGSGTLVGAGSVVLPGITIGKNCIVAAGSRVDKDILCNSVLTPAGNVYLRRSFVRNKGYR